jgi:hypothetical protein
MMLFFFVQSLAFSSPIIPILVEKHTPCAPILYELTTNCRVDKNTFNERGSGFYWNGSLWTTHHLIAGAIDIKVEKTSIRIPTDITEQNPRVDYVRMNMHRTEELTEGPLPQKGEEVLCMGFDQQGSIRTEKGVIENMGISIVQLNHTTPPLLKISCNSSPTMSGGAVVNQKKELVGMLIANEESHSYALPIHRLRKSSAEIGIHVQEEKVIYSVQPDLPVGTEVISISRQYKKASLPLIQPIEEERIRVQTVEDDVWISPVVHHYNSITIFEEKENIQLVLRPSQKQASLGLRTQDQWFPEQKTAIIQFRRGHDILFILNPEWWRNHKQTK